MSNYHFRNLVFEGGGVKGIAYVGALKKLDRKGILKQIKRVGGASAGAITAVLLSLDYSIDELDKVLRNVDFRNFMDDAPWGVIGDLYNLWNGYGIYGGEFFQEWIGKLIAEKTDGPDTTFAALENSDYRDLRLVGANLSRGKPVLFSRQTTPDTSIKKAVRISMSLPFFFRSQTHDGDQYIDGGIYRNYPVKMFDRRKYVDDPNHIRETEYYAEAEGNRIYNQETLGFRLDTKTEIKQFLTDESAIPSESIDGIRDFVMNVMGAVFDLQNRLHLHSDDWQRTIYIDTIGVGTTDFDLKDEKKRELIEEGKKGVRKYFEWYDNAGEEPSNKPDYV